MVNLDYKKLEYHGYIFSEGKVSVFLKNYSNDNYLVTLKFIISRRRNPVEKWDN